MTVDLREYLNVDQLARVEALRSAKDVLIRGGLGPISVDALDLYNIATYIVTGDDPWAGDDKPRTWAGEEATS